MSLTPGVVASVEARVDYEWGIQGGDVGIVLDLYFEVVIDCSLVFVVKWCALNLCQCTLTENQCIYIVAISYNYSTENQCA